MHLEQYLLSLYRKAFSQQISTLSPTNKDTSEQPLTARSGQCQETTENANSSKRESPPILSSSRQILKKPTDPPTKHSPVICQETQQEGARVQRSHSSVSQRAACSARISPSQESLKRALHSFYSQPLSFPKVGDLMVLACIWEFFELIYPWLRLCKSAIWVQFFKEAFNSFSLKSP